MWVSRSPDGDSDQDSISNWVIEGNEVMNRPSWITLSVAQEMRHTSVIDEDKEAIRERDWCSRDRSKSRIMRRSNLRMVDVSSKKWNRGGLNPLNIILAICLLCRILILTLAWIVSSLQSPWPPPAHHRIQSWSEGVVALYFWMCDKHGRIERAFPVLCGCDLPRR